MNGIYKIRAAAPVVKLARPAENIKAIAEEYSRAAESNAAMLLLPRLSLTGCTCGNFFLQSFLLEGALDALKKLKKATSEGGPVLTVGLPLALNGAVYNATAVMFKGSILGISISTIASGPFSSGLGLTSRHICIDGENVPIGTDIIFNAGSLRFAVMDYDDLFAPMSFADMAALAGAHLIVCPAAIQDLPGSTAATAQQIQCTAARLKAAIVLASAGAGETVSDILYAGCTIAATTEKCSESRDGSIDLDFAPAWLDFERRSAGFGKGFLTTDIRETAIPQLPEYGKLDGLGLCRLPFVQKNHAAETKESMAVLDIQAKALAARAGAIGAKRLVLGLSGGLDSTLALLASIKCAELLGQNPDFVLAVTMPGMGTSGRTKGNAAVIANELGAELREIGIKEAVLQHFRDISHDPEMLDVVYENAQARERTQILMDLANQENGIVVGTGDLSEIALGWCTFNGDHMSMYSVNSSIPKTLMRSIIACYAEYAPEKLAKALVDIVETPVSPELLPGAQHTEEIIGNYDVHDFLLFHFIRHGCSPDDLLEMAVYTFRDIYAPEKIKGIAALFGKRFLTQQFKRNSCPDGIQAAAVSLSPRGAWSAPSDISPSAWTMK